MLDYSVSGVRELSKTFHEKVFTDVSLISRSQLWLLTLNTGSG